MLPVLSPVSNRNIEPFLELYVNYGHDLLNHAYGCATVASALCEAVGVTPEEKEDIITASLLHDLGETQLPHRIFLQPSLSAKDKEHLNRHPWISVNMLGDAINEHTRKMILSHHIDSTGEGYGEGVPDKCGEIVRIADIYTALMSPRVYRNGYTINEIVSMMDKMADRKHIAPEIWERLRCHIAPRNAKDLK